MSRLFRSLLLLIGLGVLAVAWQPGAYTAAPAPAVITAEDPADPDALPRNTLTFAGDSWGFLYYVPFTGNLTDAGYQDNFDYRLASIPGTTARQWASEWYLRDLVKAIILIDLGTPTVVISLGGNDLINEYNDLGDAVYDRVEDDLRFIISDFKSIRPDVRVIMSGYDIVNMDKTENCQTWALETFGTNEPAELNPMLVELGNVQARIAADTNNVYYANVIGALQGTPGNPDITQWSPLEYFVGYPLWWEDCIHMGFYGYDVYTQAIIDNVEAAVGVGNFAPADE